MNAGCAACPPEPGGDDQVNPGHRLFARYAHAPNSRGYCGPELGAALQRLAAGHEVEGLDVEAAARRFSGAWPYQALLAEHVGIDDPLDVRVGRAYWTGNGLNSQVDSRTYGEALLARFGAQAGHYWQHLTPDLLAEVTPSHAFHVLGVYPWTRLLGQGMAEPLKVLDGCRIRAARVLQVRDEELIVETDRLIDDAPGLRLSTPAPESVTWHTADGPFVDRRALSVGDWVAVHWGFACDVLSEQEANTCCEMTARQVELTDARLRRAA